MKKCKQCLQLLPVTHFRPSSTSKDGYQWKCRSCQDKNKKWVEEKQKIVNGCRGCGRVQGGKCIGWMEPAYMWRNGKCEHYDPDPNLIPKIEAECRAYLAGRVA